jgi:MFS family permease
MNKGFLFGYDSGIITSTIGQPEFIKYFSNPSDNTTGGVVSAFQGGAILGTIINVYTGDRLGRKLTVFAGACVSIFGCALQAGAVSMAMLIIGRFIAGVAVGLLTSVVPMYAGEMAEASSRGMMSGLLQWMLSWGYLVAQWLGYGCNFVNSPFQCKKAPLVGEIVFPSVLTTLFLLQGDSLWHSSASRVSSWPLVCGS